MKLATTPRTRRDGTTTVELAVVIVIFTMLMFGILEYCLIVYTSNVVENAAREGSRFAVVNVSDTTMVNDTKTYVQSLMGGMDKTMTGYSCSVYQADATGTLVNSDPTTAQFGQYVCVEVSLNYVPITPGLIYLKQFTIHSKCSMISEAN
jgi:Flp pilus assembly protein TadG